MSRCQYEMFLTNNWMIKCWFQLIENRSFDSEVDLNRSRKVLQALD